MTNIAILKNRRVADTWRHLDAIGFEVCPMTGEVREGAHGSAWFHLCDDVYLKVRDPLEYTEIGTLTHSQDDPSAS